jgi:DNA-binding NtrC family response regulator
VRQLQNVIRNVVVLHDGDQVTLSMLPSPLNQSAQSLHPQQRAVPAASQGSGHGAGHGAGQGIAEHGRSFGQHGSGQGSVAVLTQASPEPRQVRPLWQVEKEAIEEAIAACDGNIPRAAALLEISASTIYRKRMAWEAEGRA